MSIAQWNNFTDYVVGDQVQNGSSLIYGCILANRNQAPPNVTYWNPLTPAGGGNIVSLQNLTNADIDLISSQITFTPNAGAGTIDLAVAYPANVNSLSGLTGAITQSCNIGTYTNTGQTNTLTIPLTSVLPYNLAGATAGAVIVNAPIGAGNAFTQNVFTVVSQITFNLPPVLGATESVYYDGYLFTDWQANFNSFWGVSYTTNTFATPTDILGSTTVTANALQFSNFNQIYLPLNIILPPTYLTSGGTVTLKIFCNPTSANHFLTATPINVARIGIVLN
jgi:hypothetical protein